MWLKTEWATLRSASSGAASSRFLVAEGRGEMSDRAGVDSLVLVQ